LAGDCVEDGERRPYGPRPQQGFIFDDEAVPRNF
jgi:hypothetical protein